MYNTVHTKSSIVKLMCFALQSQFHGLSCCSTCRFSSLTAPLTAPRPPASLVFSHSHSPLISAHLTFCPLRSVFRSAPMFSSVLFHRHRTPCFSDRSFTSTTFNSTCTSHVPGNCCFVLSYKNVDKNIL